MGWHRGACVWRSDYAGATMAQQTHSDPSSITDADRARVSARYPVKRSKLPIVVVAGLLLSALLGWTIWAGGTYATPGINGQLFGYTVVSDAQVDVVIKVYRPDPSKPGYCTIQAQAPSGETVAELDLPIEPATQNDVELKASLKTYLRAHTAIIKTCRLN